MATQRNGGKAKSEAGVKAGKRRTKPKKGSLRDLDAKGAKAIRAGQSCASGAHYDTAVITIRK